MQAIIPSSRDRAFPGMHVEARSPLYKLMVAIPDRVVGFGI